MYVHQSTGIEKQTLLKIPIEGAEEEADDHTAFQRCLKCFSKIRIKRAEKKGEDKHICQASEVGKQCDGASLAAPLPPSPGCSIRTSAAAARLLRSRALVTYLVLIVSISSTICLLDLRQRP